MKLLLDTHHRCGSSSIRRRPGDPADRFLAATAQVFELTLVTDDDSLLKGRGFSKLARLRSVAVARDVIGRNNRVDDGM